MKITKLIASVLATTILASFAVIPANAAKPDLSANKSFMYLKSSGAGSGNDNYLHNFGRDGSTNFSLSDKSTYYQLTASKDITSSVQALKMFNYRGDSTASGKYAHHRYGFSLNGSGAVEIKQYSSVDQGNGTTKNGNVSLISFTSGGNINVLGQGTGNVQYGTKRWTHGDVIYIDEVVDLLGRVTYMYINGDLYAKYPAASPTVDYLGRYCGVQVYANYLTKGDVLKVYWGDQPFNSSNSTVSWTYYNDTPSKTITLNDVIQDAGLGTAYEQEMYNTYGVLDPYKYNYVNGLDSAIKSMNGASVTNNDDGSYTLTRTDSDTSNDLTFAYLLNKRYLHDVGEGGISASNYCPYLGYRYTDSEEYNARWVRFSYDQEIIQSDIIRIRGRVSSASGTGENKYLLGFRSENDGAKTTVVTYVNRVDGGQNGSDFLLDKAYNSKMRVDILFDNETGLAYYFVDGNRLGDPCQVDTTDKYQICDLRYYGSQNSSVKISDFVTTLYTDGKNLDELSAEIAEKHIYWDSASDKNYLTTTGSTTSIAVTPKTVWDGAAKASNAKVFIAAYDEGENLITKFISSKNYVSGATNPDVANIGTLPSGTTKVKAFVWDWNTMESLAKPNIFSVTNN